MKEFVFAFLVAAAPLGVQSAAAQNPAPVFVPGQPSTILVPPSLMLPVGTIITVETTEPLSSNHSKAGDTFVAVLHQPLVANGWVVARRGQTVIGRVTSAQK